MVAHTLHAARPRRTFWVRLRSISMRRTIAFYGFIAPWLLCFVVLGIIPLVVGLLTSMTNYDGMNVDNLKFLWFRNYADAFDDKDMLFSLSRSALWSALNTPMWIVASFVLALILNQAVAGRDFYRTLYYLPSVVPVVATARIWALFYDTNNGLLNGIISLFRPGTAIRWFNDFALLSLTTISVWGGLGGGMVIFLAGLQGIPKELEEAALIDGANRIKVFRHVTIPLMTPVIFFQLIMALIGSLQAFALPMLIYGSGNMGSTPPRPVYLYVVHTYREIFAFQRFGYGTALLWMLFVIILALTLMVFRSARYWVHYEEGVEGEAA
jgi:multiple sugar transport system permease protein